MKPGNRKKTSQSSKDQLDSYLQSVVHQSFEQSRDFQNLKNQSTKKPMTAKLALLLKIYNDKTNNNLVNAQTSAYNAEIKSLPEPRQKSQTQIEATYEASKTLMQPHKVQTNETRKGIKRHQSRQNSGNVPVLNQIKKGRSVRKRRIDGQLSADEREDSNLKSPIQNNFSCNFSRSPENSNSTLYSGISSSKKRMNTNHTIDIPQQSENFHKLNPNTRHEGNAKQKTQPQRQKRTSRDETPKTSQHFHRKTGSTSASFSSLNERLTSKREILDKSNSPIPTPKMEIVESPHLESKKVEKSTSFPSEEVFHQVGELSKFKQEGVSDAERFTRLKIHLDAIVDSYERNLSGIQSHQSMLKLIQQKYESFISQLMQANQRLKEQITSEVQNKDSIEKENSYALSQENIFLHQKLGEVENDRKRLQDLVKSFKERRTSSTCQSILPTEKRVPVLEHESPPLTQHKKDEETSELRNLVNRQQAAISSLRKKEAKMMRLMYAMKKRGIDVELIYNEEVRGNFDHLIQYEEPIPTLDKMKYAQKEQPIKEINEKWNKNYENNSTVKKAAFHSLEDESGQDFVLSPDSKNCIDLESPFYDKAKLDSQEMIFEEEPEVLVPKKLNLQLQNKLKLDFTTLKEAKQKLNQDQKPGKEEMLGFHEEFMAKFDEFSLSWRQESMLQKNH